MGIPKVFISHSYKDKLLVDALVELLVSAGIDKQKIIASSTPGTQIHTGKSLYRELRTELSNNKAFVIFMLSDNFYSSPVCLNEMGATWIKRLKYRFMILPGFSFSNIRGVICEDSQVGFSLSLDNDEITSRFEHLRVDLEDHFGISIHKDTWKIAISDFFSVVREFKEVPANQTVLKMDSVKTFCIGDTDNDGCHLIKRDSTNKETSVIIDFEKTTSSQCSVVYQVEQRKWTGFNNAGKLLCFDINADINNICAEIELHFSDRNEQFPFLISDDVPTLRIPLSQFTVSESAWHDVKEISFLFRKKYISKTTKIVISNLHLE